jgi:hypothetical protein
MTRGSHNVVAMYVAILVHTVIFSLTESYITIMYLKHTIEDTYVEFNGRRLRLRREMQHVHLYLVVNNSIQNQNSRMS